MSTIQRRLTLVLVIASSVLGTAGGSALYITVRNGLAAGFDNMIRARAEGVAALVKQPKLKATPGEAGKLLSLNLNGTRMPSFFQIWSEAGETLERSPSLGTNDLPRPLQSFNSPQFFDLTLPDGLPGRAVGIRFVPQKRKNAPEFESTTQSAEEFTLVVARHRGALDQVLNRVKTAFILVGILMVVSNVGIVALVVRRELGSLSSLAARAATIDASSLQTRFPTSSIPGELLPICERLNDLLARLEASFARERRFTADVAHELRTPIAELRSLAEVALKYPDDIPATTQALQDALAVARQMESVTTGLLGLARCEGGLFEKRLEAVNVSTLLNSLIAGLEEQIRVRKISLSMDFPKDVYWLCDAAALRTIASNLLTNSAEYTPPGGAITIHHEIVTGKGLLRVSNTATHLTADDLPHLFERFWRKDSGAASTVHSGLGLPLAKALAESLGLEIHAELSAPRQFTVLLSGASLCLPFSSSAEPGTAQTDLADLDFASQLRLVRSADQPRPAKPASVSL